MCCVCLRACVCACDYVPGRASALAGVSTASSVYTFSPFNINAMRFIPTCITGYKAWCNTLVTIIISRGQTKHNPSQHLHQVAFRQPVLLDTCYTQVLAYSTIYSSWFTLFSNSVCLKCLPGEILKTLPIFKMNLHGDRYEKEGEGTTQQENPFFDHCLSQASDTD